MLFSLIFIYIAYTIYKIYLSTLEINFIKENINKNPVVLNEFDYKRAGNTAIINQKFSIIESIYSFVLIMFWLFVGLNILNIFIKDHSSILGGTLYILSFLIISSLLTLPLEIYRTFVKDKKLGFSKTTPMLFAKDNIKSLLLLIVFGGLFIAMILWCFKTLGSSWWIRAFVASFVILLIIQLIYPTLIAPIFNKIKPLQDENLSSSINSLLQSCGFKSKGVFVLDASKRDARLNAYFGGLGSTKRVVLFDTLIAKLSKEEILAVLGHELGHFKHKDILKMLTISCFMIFVMFFVFSHIPNSIINSLGIVDDGVGIIIVFLLFSPVLSAIFEPIISKLSRNNEFNADEFGANMKSKNDMINALKKLGSENKAFPISHKLYSAIYHSHPTLYERISRLES